MGNAAYNPISALPAPGWSSPMANAWADQVAKGDGGDQAVGEALSRFQEKTSTRRSTAPAVSARPHLRPLQGSCWEKPLKEIVRCSRHGRDLGKHAASTRRAKPCWR